MKNSPLVIFYTVPILLLPVARAADSEQEYREPPYTARCHFGSPNPTATCVYRIKSHFDPQCLEPKTSVVVRIDIDSPIPHYSVISNSGSKKEAFYCEQAIWDSAPFLQPAVNAHGKIAFTAGDAEQTRPFLDAFFKKHPSLRDKSVVIHLIPPSIRNVCTGHDRRGNRLSRKPARNSSNEFVQPSAKWISKRLDNLSVEANITSAYKIRASQGGTTTRSEI